MTKRYIQYSILTDYDVPDPWETYTHKRDESEMTKTKHSASQTPYNSDNPPLVIHSKSHRVGSATTMSCPNCSTTPY